MTGNIERAIEKALLWHPSNGGPSIDQVRGECLALVDRDLIEAEQALAELKRLKTAMAHAA